MKTVTCTCGFEAYLEVGCTFCGADAHEVKMRTVFVDEILAATAA